jgi:hypothetical protein
MKLNIYKYWQEYNGSIGYTAFVDRQTAMERSGCGWVYLGEIDIDDQENDIEMALAGLAEEEDAAHKKYVQVKASIANKRSQLLALESL